MKKNVLVHTFVWAAMLGAALMPASAQTLDNRPNHHVQAPYFPQPAVATVTYYDNNPMASSRPVGKAEVNLPAGEEKVVRRQLRHEAPKEATWASVHTANGEQFEINLYPVNRNFREQN